MLCITDPPQYLRSRVLKVNNPEEIPITDKTSKPISLKTNNKNVTQRREKFKKNLGCLLRSAMFNVVSSTALNLNVLGDRALMIAYYTLSDAVKGMICLSARNSPPKYGFNRWVVTVNVPFSGCVTSAPHVKRPWLL